MLKIKRSKEYKRMMNGEYYQPLVIETKNHRFEQTGKGHFYEIVGSGLVASGACFAAFWATIGLVLAMI